MFKSSITPEEIEILPLMSFNGRINVIDHIGVSYLRAVEYLKKQEVIGFDTETRPVFSPGQHHPQVALLQLASADEAFLFRINRTGLRSKLTSILSDENILKVGAATHDDILGLRRRREFTPRGFVDLQKIVPDWGITDRSVKKMAGIIMQGKISKAQQLSNWEAATLSEAQLKYAATDAWICREMYFRLLSEPKVI